MNGCGTVTDPQFSVVIPAFNEETRLPPYLERVIIYLEHVGSDYEIIVVDDGSSDATPMVVTSLAGKNSRLKLIELPENRGKGHAVKTGMLAARGRLRLFADADGATPIEELGRLKLAIEQGADIAIASRALKDEERTVRDMLHRKFMGTVYNLIVRTLAVRGIHDTQCGFKLFTDKAAAALFPLQRINGFGFDVEILYAAWKLGFRIVEVPVNWTDIKGTKVNIFKDSLRMLTDVLRVRLNDARGAYRGNQEAQPF